MGEDAVAAVTVITVVTVVTVVTTNSAIAVQIMTE